ncbi:MAG: 16S rRNA (guanine(966)-N(2))-methyltransferase RsmD [Rhodobiaceae bacterium]|jgi:16S rRNA (guanine966-N2)-methyltransferase|nr:16S rRNA (guanine(966)-N(2))-methyltransferase RsmD [Rhodobiaceae bacterium]
MRVVGGNWRGKPLRAPKGNDTRPTTDRTREALFSMLSSRLDFDDLRVLDLFAGTGALGLEALSRGAQFCLFVETQAPARAAIRDNVETCNATGHSKIFRRDATQLGPCTGGGAYDLVFADPPYSQGLGEQALDALLHGSWLAQDALIVVEEDRRAEFRAPAGFDELERRIKSDTELIFCTLS